jgi:hypothetical protein
VCEEIMALPGGPTAAKSHTVVVMQTPPDHSRNPPDPQPHDHDRDDDIPDTPYDEPPPIAIEDPPPPVTPGPYISQEDNS